MVRNGFFLDLVGYFIVVAWRACSCLESLYKRLNVRTIDVTRVETYTVQSQEKYFLADSCLAVWAASE